MDSSETVAKEVTLALYPNTNGVCYAIFDKPDNLIDYGVKTVRPVCNTKSMKHVGDLLDYYRPTVVLVESTIGSWFKKSDRSKLLIQKIREKAKRKKLEVYSYSRSQIREVFKQFKAKSKYEMACLIGKWQTTLSDRVPKPRKCTQSESFNMGIFDATSLALTHFYLQ